MEKLKQHYEKIVLGALLLGFVLSLVYLLQMVDSARKVTADDLKFTAPARKYDVQNFADQKYNVDYVLGSRAVWSGRQDSSKMGFTAELSVPMKALRCENAECRKIMPWDMAKKLKCPFCQGELGDPGNPPDYESQVARMDTDGDGMPDRYEVKMGLNPLDPTDADKDQDNDGFSNLYEFLVKTDPTDGRSFPGLEKCLYLYRLTKKVMPLMLNGVVQVDPKNKKTWDINLTINNMREAKLLGDTFDIGKTKYQIMDVEYRTRDRQDASVTVGDDASLVTIAPVVKNKPDMKRKMVLEVNKRNYEDNHIVLIRDVRTPTKRPYRLELNGTFTVAGEDGHKVVFQLISSNAEKEQVELLNTETESRFMLEKHMRVPRNAYVKAGENRAEQPQRQAPSRSGRRRVRN